MIAVHFLGNVWYYHAAKSYFAFRARKSMQESTGRMFSFSFSNDQLNQVRFLGSKEFVYKGMIYDIKYRKTIDNHLVIVAKADPHELFFLKALVKIGNTDGFRNSDKSSFDDTQIFPYILGASKSNSFYKESGKMPFLSKSPRLIDPELPILSPPPKTTLSFNGYSIA